MSPVPLRYANVAEVQEARLKNDGRLCVVMPRHREMMRRIIFGERQTTIAQELGYSVERVNVIVNSPLFQKELRRMERDIYEKTVDKVSDVKTRVRKLQPRALDTLEDLLDNDGKKKIPAAIRRAAAKDILDLGAGERKQKSEDGMTEFAQFVTEAYKVANEQNKKVNINVSIANDTTDPNLVKGIGNGAGESVRVIDVSGAENTNTNTNTNILLQEASPEQSQPSNSAPMATTIEAEPKSIDADDVNRNQQEALSSVRNKKVPELASIPDSLSPVEHFDRVDKLMREIEEDIALAQAVVEPDDPNEGLSREEIEEKQQLEAQESTGAKLLQLIANQKHLSSVRESTDPDVRRIAELLDL